MRRLLLLAVLIALPVPSALAQEGATLCDASASDDYLTKASGQFLRGTANTAFCWLELAHQPVMEWKVGQRNLFVGIGKGIFHSLKRGSQGIWELAIFWSPRDTDGKFARVADDCALGLARLEPQ